MTSRITIIGTGFSPSGGTTPPVEIANIVSDGFSATLIETESSEFPSTPEKRAIVEQAYLETGLRAVANGCDALYINTVGDYGLEALRNELTVPVIGAGETSAKTASLLADKFSIVTIWPESMDFIYRDLLASTHTINQCQNILHLSENDDLNSLANETNFVTELRGCSLASYQRLQQAINDAINDGSGCIITGCTCMAPAAITLEQGSVPVLEPMTLGYQFCEFWLASGNTSTPPFEAFSKTLSLQ